MLRLFLQTFVRSCWLLNAGYFLLLAKCSSLCLFGPRWIRADIYEQPLYLSGIEHVTFAGSASINSILMEKKKKKNSTSLLPTRLPAPDANSLYSNLLNVIVHKPIKLNSLGVTAGFGHLCGRGRRRAAAQSY